MILRALRGLRRNEQPVPPGYWRPGFGSGLLAGRDNPLVLPAFTAGLDYKASMIAGLNVYTMEGSGPNRRRHDYVPDVVWQPDPSEPRMTTMQKLIVSFVMHGEAVVPFTGYDDNGFPASMKVVNPAQCVLSPDGEWWDLPNGQRLHRSAVWHPIRFALPGELRGVGVLALHRMHIAGQITREQYQTTVYGRGRPSMVVKVPQGMKRAELDEFVDEFDSQIAGRTGAVYVPNGSEIEALALMNESMEFAAMANLSLIDVANMLRLPPSLVGGTVGSLTYSNSTEDRRSLIEFYAAPDLRLIEAGFTSMLPDGKQMKFDTQEFILTDPKANADVANAQRTYMTLNEIRDRQGLPPVEGGDVIAANYTLTPEANADA